MILLAILRLGEDAYGVPIAREIEETGKRRVLVAAIYAALDRLEDNGLVISSYGDPTPERGGRAKRFFKVTAKGPTSNLPPRMAVGHGNCPGTVPRRPRFPDVDASISG